MIVINGRSPAAVVYHAKARIAEEAGACAVMALERVPADIRSAGGVARMASARPLVAVHHCAKKIIHHPFFFAFSPFQSDPQMIKEIVEAVSIPVMAKVRIGHFVEAQVGDFTGKIRAPLMIKLISGSFPLQILQSIGIDYIDESEVLTPADQEYHINKHAFKVPFVCGARNLGEALRRISEGAAFIRTKGEAGTGNVVEAVRHQRAVAREIRSASVMTEEELYAYAKDIQAPFHLLKETARLKRLPVVNFAAGGIATPGAQP